MPRRGATLATVALAVAMTGSAAMAEQAMPGETQLVQAAGSRVFTFNIPAQPMTDALVRFGMQTGIDLVFDSAIAAQRQSPGVQGALDAEEALRRLLAGTGVTYRFTAPATVTLAATPTPANVTVMPEVTAHADRQKNWAPTKLSSGKFTEAVRDTPQSITVIPQSLMQEQGVFSLREALRNAPGVSIGLNDNENQSGGDNIKIRGFAANTDLFLDNMRDIAQYSRDAFSLEQIEVVKGPVSTYFGRGTTGGYVNQVTKSARSDAFYSGSASLGTSPTKRATADVNQPFEFMDGAIRLNVMGHESGVASRDYIESERWGVAPSLAFGLKGPTRLVLNYFRLEQTSLPDYGIPIVAAGVGADGHPAPVNRANYYGLRDWETDRTTNEAVTLKVEHDFEDKATLRNQFRYARGERYAVFGPPRGPNLARDVVARQAPVLTTALGQNTGILPGRDQEVGLLINQTDITARFQQDDVAMTLVTGVEFARETYDRLNFQYSNVPNTSLTSPNPFPAYSTPRTLQETSSVVAQSYGAYALATLKFFDNIEWVSGFRYDYLEADSSVYTYNNRLTTNLNDDNSLPSYRTSLLYKPAKNGSVYFAYGTSFNPSAEALTLGGSATNTNNPNVGPESNESYEIGTKWSVFEDRALISAAVFRIEKTNARTEDPLNPSDFIVLDGKQRVNGFEVGFAGNVTKDWSMFAGYTFLDSKVTESKNASERGRNLVNTPAHAFSIWTSYETPWDVQLGVGAQYAGHRYLNPGNTTEIDGYLIFDAMVGYHVTENIDLRLNLSNLTDAYYFSSGGATQGLQATPGPGRSALLSTSFRF